MIFINSPNSESQDELPLICPKEEVVSPQRRTEQGRGSAFQSYTVHVSTPCQVTLSLYKEIKGRWTRFFTRPPGHTGEGACEQAGGSFPF